MSQPYLEYFLSIESDLERCGRFVEFTSDNFKTYSVEFARIIMAAASEFDALAKNLCKLIDPLRKPDRINQYFPIITSKFPKFTECAVQMQRYKLDFKPWDGWTSESGPEWWSKGYNKIKHNRDAHFPQANLGNSILATAGLFVGILYFHRCKFCRVPVIESFQAPRLFQLGNYDPSNTPTGGRLYNIPL
jgi:hypothetical protein